MTDIIINLIFHSQGGGRFTLKAESETTPLRHCELAIYNISNFLEGYFVIKKQYMKIGRPCISGLYLEDYDNLELETQVFRSERACRKYWNNKFRSDNPNSNPWRDYCIFSYYVVD